jgi:hypothetical protein
MKTVYHLRKDTGHIAHVQSASLSPKASGLKATRGLFGSEEWWQNIKSGLIPQSRKTGTITRLFRAGMHNESQCFEMVCLDGERFEYNCIAANREYRRLYKIGAHVELTFVENELKQPILYTDGRIADTHSRSLIEVRIVEDLTEMPSN